MQPMTTRLRELLVAPGTTVLPACHDAMTARIAEQLGFRVAYLGGLCYGASSTVSEPRLTMTEFVDAARSITRAVQIPLIVDAGTGFGDPMHVMRTVEEFERAGVAGIHIEDQVFPKRAHYHRDCLEHVIPAEEMAVKIEYACRARSDPNFVIIGRTDAVRTEGFEEGMRRVRLYGEAGADAAMIYPNTAEEAERAPRETSLPLIYANSTGNRISRPLYSTEELATIGWKFQLEGACIIMSVYRAVYDVLKSLKETGRAGLEGDEARRLRKAIEDISGLEEYYRVEEQTVEAAAYRH